MSINTARWLILQLGDRGIVKPASVSDAEEVDVFDDGREDRIEDGTYRVVYVGVVVANDFVVYGPKYFHHKATSEELRPVFSALRRYQSDSEDTKNRSPSKKPCTFPMHIFKCSTSSIIALR